MGFGFKTTWMAVRDRSPELVADALALIERREVPYDQGVDLAYDQGVFVFGPVAGWTLAHGRRHVGPQQFEPTSQQFPAWLAELSRVLGEVQFFANERGWSHHAWAHAVNGQILRAYAVSDGNIPLFIGEPTAVEVELGKGTRGYAADWQTWQETDWDAWHETVPDEFNVIAVASAWSVDPQDPVPNTVSHGIYGLPPAGEK